jgi:hypothetical protein
MNPVIRQDDLLIISCAISVVDILLPDITLAESEVTEHPCINRAS